MSSEVTASAYLVVKATRQQWGSVNPETGLRKVESAKIVMARQGRPGQMGKDEVLVKVTVQLPAAVFDPITPSALVVVPEEMILGRHEIQVEANEEGVKIE